MNIIKIILIVFIVKNNNCFTYFIINQSITSCRSLYHFLHQINQIYQKKLLSSHHMLLLVFCILTFFLSCSWIIILILNRINQHNWKTYIFNISFRWYSIIIKIAHLPVQYFVSVYKYFVLWTGSLSNLQLIMLLTLPLIS